MTNKIEAKQIILDKILDYFKHSGSHPLWIEQEKKRFTELFTKLEEQK